MEKIIKTEKNKHDCHDILLGILYYFPKEGKWDEISFHEALSNIIEKYPKFNNLKFQESNGTIYCGELGKIFDLLSLSGLWNVNNKASKLELDLIKAHFDEEMRLTFNNRDLEMLKEISKEIKKVLDLK